MTRRPPSITSVESGSAGGLQVGWELDGFFADSEAPEAVLVDVNGVEFSRLGGDATSVEIPTTQLGTGVVTVSITFWWSGSPAEEQQSSVQVSLGAGPTGGGTGVIPAAKPVLTVGAVTPKTLATPNRITIAWRSNNYNDGNLIWGPETSPGLFRRSIKPTGERYEGSFSTDQRLVAGTRYLFKVEVRNTLQSPAWTSTTALVRAARNFSSLRGFLTASGLSTSGGLRAVLGQGDSLRELLDLPA